MKLKSKMLKQFHFMVVKQKIFKFNWCTHDHHWTSKPKCKSASLVKRLPTKMSWISVASYLSFKYLSSNIFFKKGTAND